MPEAGVTQYVVGVLAALALVLIVGTLAVRIIGLASGILAVVTRCRRAVEQVESNVSVIPQLGVAATTSDRILAGALAIEGKVHLLADSIEGREAPALQGGRSQ